MPNRIIRETICTSDSIDGLSWFEEVLFYRLIVSCDDFGRYDGRTAVIKNRLFPLKENLTLKTVENALHGLASAGLVVLYKSQGGRFLYLPTWGKYQQQRAKVSKYPEPSADILHQLDGVSKQTIADDSKCNQAIANVPVIENRESGIDIRESGSENGRVAPTTPMSDTLSGLDTLSPGLRGAVEDWLRYKAERREPYKPQGLKYLITVAKNNAAKYGDAAVEKVIYESMSGNYKGIIFDRLAKAQQEQGGAKKPNQVQYDKDKAESAMADYMDW